MRQVNKIIIHCSDSDNPNHDDISVIREWHTSPSPHDSSKPWSDVGYHYFIKGDGTIQKGRPEERIGAHCYGQNGNSIGICLHGIDQFSDNQFIFLNNLIRHIMKRHDIEEVSGHYNYSKHKTCPNFDVDEFLKNYGLWDSLKKY